MCHCKLNNTIGIYRLQLITYALVLIFPLIYKYQQLNVSYTANVNTLCAHYNCADSVLQIPCEKPTLKLIQMYINLSEHVLGNSTNLQGCAATVLRTCSVAGIYLSGLVHRDNPRGSRKSPNC
jgi:hypothetical protein